MSDQIRSDLVGDWKVLQSLVHIDHMLSNKGLKPSENELWPGLAFSGCGWKIYGELWKPDAASLSRMSPTHASFFVPFWNLLWMLVWTPLVTNLEISGLICNLQGCSGCFGTHCICKNSIDCTEKYSFFRGSTGVIWGARTFPCATCPKSPKSNLSVRSVCLRLREFAL